MYNISEDYKNVLNKNVRTPRSKIVVGSRDYTGQYDLLSSPKITQETTMMIGGFPAKTVEFDLYDKNGNINLLNSDIAVYRGYDIGDLISVLNYETSNTSNVSISGLNFTQGFKTILRGFHDSTKQVLDYNRILSSTADSNLYTQVATPNILIAKVLDTDNVSFPRPQVDLSSFTKDDFLTITIEYDLNNCTLTATDGITTVTNSVVRTGIPSVGNYFTIGSQISNAVSTFTYASVEIQTTADNKVYKFIADESERWKSIGDRATYAINGKWDIGVNTEYVPMGIYKARAKEDIINNSTGKKITFKGTDKAVEFNNIHNTINDPTFPCTYLDYLKSIVEDTYDMELERENFPFASTTMSTAPNTTSTTTDRDLIGRFAEMCGGIACMSRSGKVDIVIPNNTETEISKDYYNTLSSKEDKYGQISRVVLGRSSQGDTDYEDVVATDNTISNKPYGRNILSLLKVTQISTSATVNSIEDNKIVITSSLNAGTWQSVSYWLDSLELGVGTYTLYGKGLSTNNTSTIKNCITISKYSTRDGNRVGNVDLFTHQRNSIQFTIEDGFYYRITFYASTNKPIVGTNTATYSDVYIAKENSFSKYEPYQNNGTWTWRIDDNPYLDLIRENMINSVATNIFGQSVIPFEINDCIDDFIYDLNDIVKVQDKFGSWYDTRILKISSNSRMRTVYGAYTQEEETSYNLQGSTSDVGKVVKLDVDRINGQITTINENIDGIGTQLTQSESDFNFLFTANGTMTDYIRFEDGNIIIGKVDSEMTMKQYNDRIEFLQDGVVIGSLQYNIFKTEDLIAKKTLQIGKYIFQEDDDGSFTFDLGGE